MANTIEAFLEELPDIVLFHRKKSGLSRIKLAKFAEVDKKVIQAIEQGKQTVQLANLFKVLNVLNIKCDLSSPLMPSYRNQD